MNSDITFRTINTFGRDIYYGTITLKEADTYQSSLLVKIEGTGFSDLAMGDKVSDHSNDKISTPCWILIVQVSSTWLSQYILISLGFLLSSILIIMKQSYVSIICLIVSGSSLTRKFSKVSHGAVTRDNIIIITLMKGKIGQM